jgi:hypothetical protein
MKARIILNEIKINKEESGLGSLGIGRTKIIGQSYHVAKASGDMDNMITLQE